MKIVPFVDSENVIEICDDLDIPKPEVGNIYPSKMRNQILKFIRYSCAIDLKVK